MVLDQWWQRRQAFQLVWGIGLVWYGISAGAEFLGGAMGWSEPVYRTWYLIGAFLVPASPGAGTLYLLSKTRSGSLFGFSFAPAGLFSIAPTPRYPAWSGAGFGPPARGLSPAAR